MTLLANHGIIGKQAAAESELLTGLVSAWNFDELSGNLIDQHGSNDGTLVGGVTQGVAGQINTAYDFNGGYISVSDVPFDYEYTQPFSISIWANPDTTDAVRVFLSKRQTSDTRGWLFYTQSSNVVEMLIGNTASNRIRVLGSTTLSAGDGWYHIVMTYSGNGLASGINLYVNNSIETPDVQQDSLGGNTILNNANLEIGDQSNLNNFPYDGQLDEGRFWTKELTPTLITELYTKENGGTGYPWN